MNDKNFPEATDSLELLKSRHSVRAYTEEPVSPDLLKELNADITMVNTHEAGFHFSIVTDDPAPFSRFDKSYGSFRNVRNYLACIVDTSFPDVYEKAGFYAERFALKCVSLGLGTCFVGGTFRAYKVALQFRPDWKLLFVVVFGNAAESERPMARLMAKFVHRRGMTPEDFFSGSEVDLKKASNSFPWIPNALEALACAPSALNRRPVRLRVCHSSDSMEVKAFVQDVNDSNLIDLGIAKCNMSMVSPGEWEWGNDAPFLLD